MTEETLNSGIEIDSTSSTQGPCNQPNLPQVGTADKCEPAAF